MNETRDSFTKAEGSRRIGPESTYDSGELSLPVFSIVSRFLRGHSFELEDCECCRWAREITSEFSAELSAAAHSYALECGEGENKFGCVHAVLPRTASKHENTRTRKLRDSSSIALENTQHRVFDRLILQCLRVAK